MTTRDLKKRLERLENSMVSEDDLFANMPVTELLELYLRVDEYLRNAGEGAEDAENGGDTAIRWPESVAPPTAEEIQAVHRRADALARRDNTDSVCRALSAREVLIVFVAGPRLWRWRGET